MGNFYRILSFQLKMHLGWPAVRAIRCSATPWESNWTELPSPHVSSSAHAGLMICDPAGIIACFRHMVDFDTGCVPFA